MLVHQGSLIVAGYFHFLADGQNCYSIARWDGANWHPMGSGFSSGTVEALGIDPDGHLIAGGNMAYSGSTVVHNVARWTGASWQPLGSGLSSTVYCIDVYNGELVVGGGFRNDYLGHALCGIARWRGSQWEGLAQTYPAAGATVRDLEIKDGDLYAGGSFNSLEGAAVRRLARWDGVTWQQGTGIPEDVAVTMVDSAGDDLIISGMRDYTHEHWDSIDDGVAMAMLQIQPYEDGWAVAGGFSIVGGGLVAPCFALWDGANWSALASDGQGTNDRVAALAEYQGRLIAGGNFTTAGGAVARRLAAWDGAQWQEIGSGVSDAVSALASDGEDLFVAGHFMEAGGVPATRIARWDGSQFHALGSGLGGGAYALAFYQGDLIAAGDFTTAGGAPANYIARWDGLQWHPLGAGVNFWVHALLVREGRLLVAGEFTQAGGAPASRLAAWDGSQWTEFAGGADGAVFALADYHGDLVVGGYFEEIGDSPDAPRIARQTADGWQPFGSGFTLQYCWSDPDGEHCEPYGVEKLAVVGDKLYAAGFLASAGGVTTAGIARWDDGNHWLALDEGIPGSISDLRAWDGALFVGGSFEIAGDEPSENIAAWDDPARLPDGAEHWWAGFDGNGPNDTAYAFADFGSQLVVGGAFREVGDVTTNGVAAWDGHEWLALGSGLGPAQSNWARVYDLLEYHGDLYAAGLFTLPPATEICNLARWDGANWEAIGLPVTLDPASALAIYDDKLIVGGSFTQMSGVEASRIVAWDGTTFTPLGTGLSGSYPFWVGALAVQDGKLIAGGSFTGAGGQLAQHLAIWNGAAWESPPAAFFTDREVQSLCSHGDDLYVGGNFDVAGGQSLSSVARWDGTEFTALGAGLSGTSAYVDIWDLRWIDGRLFAAGSFIQSNGQPVPGVATWDGAAWTSFGGGTGFTARALALWNDDLYIGGDFLTAGGKNSPHIARWISTATAVDATVPASLRLDAAYPNPFNPNTTIGFTVPAPSHVVLTIHDARGRLIRTLIDEARPAGPQTLTWNGRDMGGRQVGSGVYLVRLRSHGQVDVRKVTLLK